MASLSRTPYFLFTAFSITLLPVVTSALRRHGRKRAGELIARSTTFLFVCALPFVAIMAAVPAELLDFVFPLSYASAADALVWAVAAQTLLALVASFTAAITADGKPYMAMVAWLVCIPTQLVAGARLIPGGGMTGAAVASLIAALAGVAVSGTMTWYYFRRLFDPVAVLKAVAAAAIVYVLLSLPDSYSLLVLPFACMAALAVYVGLVLVSGAVKLSEIAALFRSERDLAPNDGESGEGPAG
jgi:O-antigen/teichoic acid export membrane protein